MLRLKLQTVKTMSSNPKKTKDRSSENFRKRWRTFQKQGNDVHKIYQAEVYILLRRKGQIYEFKSTDEVWPLPPAEVASFATQNLQMLKLTADRRSVFPQPFKSPLRIPETERKKESWQRKGVQAVIPCRPGRIGVQQCARCDRMHIETITMAEVLLLRHSLVHERQNYTLHHGACHPQRSSSNVRY